MSPDFGDFTNTKPRPAIADDSHCGRILAWMLDGRTISQIEATHEFGCTRLAARILDLKAAGHLIEDRRVRAGRHKSFSIYWIAKPRTPTTGQLF